MCKDILAIYMRSYIVDKFAFVLNFVVVVFVCLFVLIFVCVVYIFFCTSFIVNLKIDNIHTPFSFEF